MSIIYIISIIYIDWFLLFDFMQFYVLYILYILIFVFIRELQSGTVRPYERFYERTFTNTPLRTPPSRGMGFAERSATVGS